jgi:hypothetical protein
MPAQQLIDLGLQLDVANEAVAKLTLANAELTKLLAEAETRNKKLKRNSRNDESSFRTQLATAQNRRAD